MGVKNYKLLRVKEAAQYCSVHPATLRRWVKAGKIPYTTVGREKRLNIQDLDTFMGIEPKTIKQVEAHYVRVNATPGQETSITGQIDLLDQKSEYPVFKTYVDKGSGLNEKRPRFVQMLKDAKDGKFTVLRITHPDRLTRFGYCNLVELLKCYGVEVVTLDDTSTKSGQEELLEDFMSLVASFSGRMYGMRSREHKHKLLKQAGADVDE